MQCVGNGILDIRTYAQTGAVCRRADLHFFDRCVTADRNRVETVKDLHAAADHDIEIVVHIHGSLDRSQIYGAARVDHRSGRDVVGCPAVVQDINIAVIGFQGRIVPYCDPARTGQLILCPHGIAGEEAAACRISSGIQHCARVVHDRDAFLCGQGALHIHLIVGIDFALAHREAGFDAETDGHSVCYALCGRFIIGFYRDVSAGDHSRTALDVSVCRIVAVCGQSGNVHRSCTDDQALLDLRIHNSGVHCQYIDIAASFDDTAADSGGSALRTAFGKGDVPLIIYFTLLEGADAGIRLRVRKVIDSEIAAVFGQRMRNRIALRNDIHIASGLNIDTLGPGLDKIVCMRVGCHAAD